MGMDKLRKVSQKIEAINRFEPAMEPECSPRQYHRRISGPRFEERHHRVTTYLENDLFQHVESLREQGKILNLTALFNEALREHLKIKFGK